MKCVTAGIAKFGNSFRVALSIGPCWRLSEGTAVEKQSCSEWLYEGQESFESYNKVRIWFGNPHPIFTYGCQLVCYLYSWAPSTSALSAGWLDVFRFTRLLIRTFNWYCFLTLIYRTRNMISKNEKKNQRNICCSKCCGESEKSCCLSAGICWELQR